MTPGDLLYIPRGQYHDAIASSEASLHLTFGIVPLVGVDVFDGIKSELECDPLFNQPLPHYDNQDALKSHLGFLAKRIAEVISSPQAGQLIRDHQQNAMVLESFPTYDMPFFGKILCFKVENTDSSRYDNKIILKWLSGRDWFTNREFAEAFPKCEIDSELRDLIKLGKIKQIS